jgi:hypothetical protein
MKAVAASATELACFLCQSAMCVSCYIEWAIVIILAHLIVASEANYLIFIIFCMPMSVHRYALGDCREAGR